jgi:hypothetical protein
MPNSDSLLVRSGRSSVENAMNQREKRQDDGIVTNIVIFVLKNSTTTFSELRRGEPILRME